MGWGGAEGGASEWGEEGPLVGRKADPSGGGIRAGSTVSQGGVQEARPGLAKGFWLKPGLVPSSPPRGPPPPLERRSPTCSFLDEDGVAFEDERERRGAMNTQMEHDLQDLQGQSRGAGRGPGRLCSTQLAPPASPCTGRSSDADLTLRVCRALSWPHLELHAAGATVQTVQKVLQEALAAAQ